MDGLIGKKVGSTRVFTDEGHWISVTVLEVGPCAVIQRKTRDTDGYDAVQLGFGSRKKSRVNKPELGRFRSVGQDPVHTLRELRVDAASELKPGDEIKASIFGAGDRVDVSGTSKGKGFAGVIKRHGFSGGPGGHGSHFHRAPGSIGQSADPAKVIKGKRLPGRMGNQRVTVQNLEVVQVDAEKDLVLVRGAVPGPNGAVVMIKKSVKRKRN